MRIGRILILLVLTASCAVKPDCSLQCIGEGFAATTVNTCVFRGASVTSDGYYRAAAFYDADSYVNIAFQKQGSDTWDVKRTQYKGHTADAHNVKWFDSSLVKLFEHGGHEFYSFREESQTEETQIQE